MTSASEERRPRRADFERNVQRIIEAATDVLAEDPAANMTQIAKASGLVRATLYRHFPAREDLLVAIFRHALDQVAAALAEAEPERGPAPQALGRVLDALAVIGDRYRVITGSHGLREITDPELLASAVHAFAPVNELIERGQREQTLRADLSPRWIVAAAVALVNESARAIERGDLVRDEAGVVVRRTLLEPLIIRRRPTKEDPVSD